MKFSIITVCLNSEKTILYTLNSILNQTYKNIEHLIIDGGSTDRTLEIIKNYPFKNKKFFSTNCKGIYSAINEGIKRATGEYISVLHSDDVYQNNCILEQLSKIIKKNKKYEIFLGNVVYFRNKISEITRFYSGLDFKLDDLKYGIMPPHTGSFISKNIYRKFGYYKTNYRIASDFDFFLRIIFIHKVKFFKIDKVITRMRAGGISGKNLISYFISTREIMKSFNENKIITNLFNIILRLLLKSLQFINFSSSELNKSYNFIYTEFLKKFKKPELKIVQTSEKLFINRNFILSALNLAFLGSYVKGEIKIENNLICWPDGYFAKTVDSSLYKVPGRNLINTLNIPKNINEIVVLGNLSVQSKHYLKKKFKKKITHLKLIYGNVDKIKKSKNIVIKKNQLIFITLPTPKQEIFAQHLAKKNKNYKIICIGGSIAITSGEEIPVPAFMNYLEFLWRLRYETYRRIIRLFNTFKYFIYGKFFIHKLEFKELERQ
jgi:glycosyltransferase involved in cell wall biosynthesis